ncbi:hypothetical protein B0H14DRAFT_3428431 [Mycena olivaceomarginata]|nr:hypothetical protein B0H14DRAFT_3428431 [Mycena olivaceomarginata]
MADSDTHNSDDDVPVPPGFDDNLRDIISPTFNAFPDFVDDLFPAPVQSQYGPAFDAITQEPAVLHPPTFDAAGEDLPPSAVTLRAQPRPIFHGAVFAPERAIGTSPGGGQNRSIYAPSGLFRAFSSGPSAHSPVTSTSLTSASVASSATTITDVGGLFRSTPLFPSTLAWFNATLAKNSGASQATVAPEPSTSPTASLGMPPPPTSVTFAASAHATSSPLPSVSLSAEALPSTTASTLTNSSDLSRPASSPMAPAAAGPASLVPMSVAAVLSPPASTAPFPPQYIESRPMANPPKPKGGAKSSATKPPAKRGRPRKDASTVSADVVEPTPAPAPTPRPRGRPCKSAAPALDSIDASSSASASANANDRNVVPPMTEAARVESDRIHREEARMREERAELRRREKEMEAKEAALEAERQRLRNPAGGADLVVVSRPKRAVKATQNPDGSPVIRPVTKKRAEVAGSRLAITVVDPNTRQANEDAALLKRLNGKRKAADPPATKPRAAKGGRQAVGGQQAGGRRAGGRAGGGRAAGRRRWSMMELEEDGRDAAGMRVGGGGREAAGGRRRAAAGGMRVQDGNAPQIAWIPKKANQENQPPLKSNSAGTHAPTSAEIHAFLEKNYNIDGCNTIDIVHARRENDEIKQILEEREAKITAQEAEKAKLMKEVAALQARLVSAPASGAASAEPEEPSGAEQRQDATKALEHEQHKNAELQKRLDALSGGGAGVEDSEREKIPRPAGSAGNNFNIQNAMGLGNGRANREIYKGILRNLRDLLLQAGINWESPWAQVPVDAKSKFFRVARKRHPILEQYENDWAAEEIAKQYVKNKRRNAYKHGWLEVPAQYAYLKDNSAKRDQSGSRKRRAAPATSKKATSATKKATAAAKKAAIVKKVQSRQPAKSAGKNKAKQVVVDEEEEEEEEEEGSDARMSGTDSDN